MPADWLLKQPEKEFYSRCGLMAKICIIAGNSRSLLANRKDLIDECVRQGHELISLIPRNEFDEDQHRALNIQYELFNLERTTISLRSDLTTIYDLSEKFKRIKPDVVLTSTIKPVIYGSLGAKLAGVERPFAMITGLGHLFTDKAAQSNRARWIAKKLYKIALPINKKVFFQNPDDLQLFISLKLIKKDQGVLIDGSGINLERFSHSEPPTSPVNFLFMNRLLKSKGVLQFVEAAKEISEKYSDVKFVIIGKHEPNVMDCVSREEIERWKSEGYVEFLGFQSDVRPFLQQSSVVVLPGWYREGVPRALLEGLAVGRPIITTNTPGCKETVKEGYNGYLVPPRDVDALIRAMEWFIENPESIQEMGLRSRSLAENRFDVRLVNKKIMRTVGLMNDRPNDLDG